uniref:NADH-ubiquinone oxidoreductase chain 3 n=1 Tax=Hymenolepis microstoma TaxID=85433 RepID=A0A1E1GI21_HYMMI|nr:NADH dehydrogenase subunit 3 [Hymenolepis microstoma]BBB87192.1 NADH dehydrogenase subunit 3 [Hymenolepis microstoma]
MVALLYGLLIFLILFMVIYFFSCGLFNQNSVVSVSWLSPYECGFSPSSLSFNCFSFTYFSLLVFFVIFDLEISLLLNMSEQGILYENFYFYYFFILILVVGFLLELFMGYVRWGY